MAWFPLSITRACLLYARQFHLRAWVYGYGDDSTSGLSDDQWERIEPLLPSNTGRKGHPFRDNRKIVEGIIYRSRTGISEPGLHRPRQCIKIPRSSSPKQKRSRAPGLAGPPSTCAAAVALHRTQPCRS